MSCHTKYLCLKLVSQFCCDTSYIEYSTKQKQVLLPQQLRKYCRVQRKSFLQLAIRASLKLTFTSPNIISTSPKNVLMSRLIWQYFCNLNSSKNFTCPSGKLITELTSPIAKSTSPGLLDTTFFERCTAAFVLSGCIERCVRCTERLFSLKYLFGEANIA